MWKYVHVIIVLLFLVDHLKDSALVYVHHVCSFQLTSES